MILLLYHRSRAHSLVGYLITREEKEMHLGKPGALSLNFKEASPRKVQTLLRDLNTVLLELYVKHRSCLGARSLLCTAPEHLGGACRPHPLGRAAAGLHQQGPHLGRVEIKRKASCCAFSPCPASSTLKFKIFKDLRAGERAPWAGSFTCMWLTGFNSCTPFGPQSPPGVTPEYCQVWPKQTVDLKYHLWNGETVQGLRCGWPWFGLRYWVWWLEDCQGSLLSPAEIAPELCWICPKAQINAKPENINWLAHKNIEILLKK